LIESHASDGNHILILCHNPGLEKIAVQLDEKAPGVMPTCSMSHFVWDSDAHLWNFHWFDYPKSNRQ